MEYRRNLIKARQAKKEALASSEQAVTTTPRPHQREGLMRPGRLDPTGDEPSVSAGNEMFNRIPMPKSPSDPISEIQQYLRGVYGDNPQEVPSVGGFWGGLLAASEDAQAQADKEEVSPQAPESSIRPEPRPGIVGVGDLSDVEILALTLQAEAGGEGYEGMLAAGSVIANRAASGKYGKGIKGVIMKPGQFSAWNGVTGYAGGEGAIDMDKVRPTKSALKAAEDIISGNYKDITGGATHYYNPNVASPKWGGEAGQGWTDIGNHRFGWAD